MAFWARFHVVKAVLGGVLLVLVVRLARRTWHEYVGSRARGRRARLAVAGVLEAPLLLLAVLLVAANVQGALAPMSSALGLLPVGRGGTAPDGVAEGGMALTVREIRRALQSPDAAVPPALTRLVGDFAAYHAVMVGVGAVVTLGLAVLAVRVWPRRGVAAEPWHLRGPRVVTAVSVLGLAAAFAVISAANLSTFLHPAPALLGFFDGGA
ncbi:hypothetical protein [Intrasporangium sp. YIM S08009]|uniref:hypothetical protein n=1 Tax=Intrasporangium zincisolvens TaxID=3080018 RepID=UPI002B053D90|nr:hypothetical protein [Intrasporangium sp. YIM S08009]